MPNMDTVRSKALGPKFWKQQNGMMENSGCSGSVSKMMPGHLEIWKPREKLSGTGIQKHPKWNIPTEHGPHIALDMWIPCCIGCLTDRPFGIWWLWRHHVLLQPRPWLQLSFGLKTFPFAAFNPQSRGYRTHFSQFRPREDREEGVFEARTC